LGWVPRSTLPERCRRDRGDTCRLLDHARASYAKLDGLEYLVLDEPNRMLDMGFLPGHPAAFLRQLPRSGTAWSSALTIPAPIAALASEMLKKPATISLQRKAAPAVGITQAPSVPQESQAGAAVRVFRANILGQALVFTADQAPPTSSRIIWRIRA